MITSYAATQARKRTRRKAHLLALPAALFTFIACQIARRKAIASLERMSDHQLRDIGIGRGDIDNVVHYGRSFD